MILMRRLFVCALVTVAAACNRADNAPPVATATFTASKARLPLGSPVDLTYTFDVGPGAPTTGDYRVFVHFLDSDGQQMWTDDHDPPVPTSRWQPGQKVQYTRTIFMPIFPYQGPATVTLGLYNGPRLEDRAPLAGKARGREYTVGTLEILPQSENIHLSRRDGWHFVEMLPENPAHEWQWTGKSATLTFRNQRQDVVFYLESDGQPAFFSAPQTVSVHVNGAKVHEFKVDRQEPVLRRLPISAAQMGNADIVEIRLEVDKSFVPARTPGAGPDQRELGIRVYHTFVEAAR